MFFKITIVTTFPSVEELRKNYPRAEILEIDNRTVMGTCESCYAPCVTGTAYITGKEGDYFCPPCADKILAGAN